jgi:hypothetical protein
MTTPPRLHIVHGGPPPPEPEDVDDADAADAPPAAIDARFPDDATPTGPDADPAAAAARAARVAAIARQVVAGLAGFQFLACLRYLHWYAALVRDGAVSPAALLAVPACLALYAATGLLVARRAPAACRTLFVAAAMALAVSVPFWGITDDWTWPLELGATLALAGAWYARPRGEAFTAPA